LRLSPTRPSDAKKTAWHDGFDRYDFVMDEATLAITPFKAPDGEKFGRPRSGQGPATLHRRRSQKNRRRPAMSWQGCYWDHQPQAEVELLRRGFHIAYISANATLKPARNGMHGSLI